MEVIDPVKLENIQNILKENIKQSQLPEFFYNYMSGMIIEEPPSEQQELYYLIGEFIQNGNKVTQEQALNICKQIQQSLVEKQLIQIQNKLSIQAERLDGPITLNSLNLLGDTDNNDEDFFGRDRQQYNDDIQYLDKNGIKIDKKKAQEQKKVQEAYQKHVIEMEKNKKKLPPTVVQHKKTIGGSLEFLVENITLVVGGRTLLDNSRIQLTYGRKYGMIGRNGIGKTCLLSAIARGEFEKMTRHLQILLVEQEVEGTDQTPLEVLLEADVERTKLMQREKELETLETPEALQEINQIYQRLTEIDAYDAEVRALQILNGLGFSKELLNRPTKLLSGGWRMRVTLSRALFVQPDILFLDEPTNHLDLDAVMWLEDYLIKCKNTVVIVSHAREFLNAVCTDIIHFKDEKLEYYKGNYDQFDKTKNEKFKMQNAQSEAQKMKIAHMQEFIDKFRYNSKRASLVQSRIKAINKMDKIEEILEDPSIMFMFPTPDKIRPPILKIDDGVFGYNKEQILLKNLSFGIDMDSRIAILGPNGVGKSTFLKLLTGQLELVEGQQYRHGRLRVSMFTQHHMDQLNLIYSPLEQFSVTYPGSPVETYRSHLGSFGVTGNLQLRPMYMMSGGQKSRVAFAMAVWNNPHIMILDEPTNHLDIDAVNALIVALNNFQGGVLIVSHDQHLVASTCDHIWYIKEQRLKKFNGDFDDYRRALQNGRL